MILNVPEGMPLSITAREGVSRELMGAFTIWPGNFPGKQIKPNNERGGAFCQVSGIWYPTSQLRVDGLGRTVGVDYWVPGRPD